ncbi:MAG: hypothetical protein RIA69_08620 [Cyclobacteriaceae bacterium]
MSIIAQLSTSLNRRDQGPNKALAKKLINEKNEADIAELIQIIKHPPNQKILFDALKVSELLSEKDPNILANDFDLILTHVKSKTNKVAWMAMCVLSHISPFRQKETYQVLPSILHIMDHAGVIQRDKGITILLALYKNYTDEVGSLLLDQILSCPPNQVGQYAEKWMSMISEEEKPGLISALEQRLAEFDHPSHIKRTTKNLKKLNKTTAT